MNVVWKHVEAKKIINKGVLNKNVKFYRLFACIGNLFFYLTCNTLREGGCEENSLLWVNVSTEYTGTIIVDRKINDFQSFGFWTLYQEITFQNELNSNCFWCIFINLPIMHVIYALGCSCLVLSWTSMEKLEKTANVCEHILDRQSQISNPI